MQLSAKFCRAQAAHHRSIAAGAPLNNVKGVALLAAAAWAKEAQAADHREKRRAGVKLQAVLAAPGLASGSVGTDDSLFSENPDRGFVTASMWGEGADTT